MKKNSFWRLMAFLACINGCAFKPHQKQKSLVINGAIASTQTVFGWKGDGTSHSREESQAIRLLTSSDRVRYRSGHTVTLPQVVPNFLTIIARNTERSMKDISFIKASVIIDGKKYQLSANYLLNNSAENSITLTFTGLQTLLSPKASQSAELVAELFNTNEKVLTYSFLIRTPPSNVTFDFMSATESVTALKIPENFVAPTVNNKNLGMVQLLKVTNNEPEPIDVQIPTVVQASLTQSVVRQNYEDRQCHGGDFKYWQTTWNDLYSAELRTYPVDEELLTNLEASFNAEAKPLSDIRIPPHQYALISLYSVSDLAWLFERDAPIASTLQIKRVLAGCYVTSTDCEQSAGEHSHMSCRSETRRYEKDLAIGETRGELELAFSGERTISLRYADLDLSEDAEVRTVEAFPARMAVKR